MTTKTDDIKLPPEFCSANGIPVERATIKRERMVEILCATVEADRRVRGEPVKVPSDEILTAVIHYGDCRFDERGATDKRDAADSSAQAYADICRLLSRYGQPATSAELVKGCHRSHPHENMDAECERLTIVARENFMRASAAPVAQEPVAFLCRECDEEGWSTYAVMPNERLPSSDLMHVTPLYTAPVAAQPSVPEGFKLFPEWKIRRTIQVLSNDGDEHGVAADLEAMLSKEAK